MTRTKFTVLPIPGNDSEKEDFTHSSFSAEYRIFCHIREGNVELVKEDLENYFGAEMIMGKMSGNSLRQVQYWAVSTIAVAVHYAILGGVDETDAFNLSDKVIRKIDCCQDVEEIFYIIKQQAIIITDLVQKSSESLGTSLPVKKCIHYIKQNFRGKINLKDLAKVSGLSENYISSKFKKEMGQSLNSYILHEKIEEAKKLLMADENYLDIVYRLGFCSESQFIAQFKKVTGITPGKYNGSF